jgi:hypothetical protein
MAMEGHVDVPGGTWQEYARMSLEGHGKSHCAVMVGVPLDF